MTGKRFTSCSRQTTGKQAEVPCSSPIYGLVFNKKILKNSLQYFKTGRFHLKIRFPTFYLKKIGKNLKIWQHCLCIPVCQQLAGGSCDLYSLQSSLGFFSFLHISQETCSLGTSVSKSTGHSSISRILCLSQY